MLELVRVFRDRFHRRAESNARKVEGEENENLVEWMVKSRISLQKEKDNRRGIEDTITGAAKGDVLHSATTALAKDEARFFALHGVQFQVDLYRMAKELEGKGEKGDEKDLRRVFEEKEIGEQFAEFHRHRANRLEKQMRTDRRNVGEKTNGQNDEEEQTLFGLRLDEEIDH